jgi:hypothetical protein
MRNSSEVPHLGLWGAHLKIVSPLLSLGKTRLTEVPDNKMSDTTSLSWWSAMTRVIMTDDARKLLML